MKAPKMVQSAASVLRARFGKQAASDALPERIHIETTSFCNLNCEYCVLREQVDRKEVMPFEKFSSLERYFPMVKGVTLSGIAEPLVNKQIVDCVRLIKRVSPGCHVGMFSNAELLDARVSDGLVSAGLDAFEFSLDGCDAGLVDSIRRGGSLERVVENVRGLLCTRDARGVTHPNLLATCVLQQQNYRQLPGIVALAGQLGVRRLSVNGLEPYKEQTVPCALWVTGQTPADLPDILDAALDEAKKLGITVRLTGLVPNPPTCNAVKAPVILANGDVTACSVLAYHRKCFFRVNGQLQVKSEVGEQDARVFGNVFEMPLEDIWDSPAYVAFRAAVLKNTFPDICQRCLIKHGHICARTSRDPREVVMELRHWRY
jgi:MoaA/NifB/PqqE/SkfB family radical SAM enzyme